MAKRTNKAGKHELPVDVNYKPRSIILHIPKTGGMGFRKMSERLAERGDEAPLVTRHNLSLKELTSLYPEAKVSFILRDPVERAASGFRSRLRMGRPLKFVRWSPSEAAAFSFFRTPFEWLSAIDSDDERLKSAAIFTYDNINVLARNYCFYFESIESTRDLRSHIGLVGEIERTDDFLKKFLSDVAPGVDDISEVYSAMHISPVRTASEVEMLSDAQMKKVREFFAPEYEIYDYLKTLVNC